MIVLKKIIKKFKFKFSKNNDFDDSKLSQTKIWNSLLIFSIIGSFSFALVYAFLVKIDEVVVARGELQAIGAERPVKANISGIVKEVLIREGQKVKKGQLLITIDSESQQAKLVSLLKEKQNLEKELSLQKDIIYRTKKVYDEGAISFLEILNLEKTLLEITSELERKEAEIKVISISIRDSNIKSPVNGNIFNLIPKSSGYFTNLGETLLEVVPDGKLEAKIFVNNSDIGFVKENMKAEIRIDAFPFSRFGSLSGEIKNIGDEVLPIDNLNPQSRFPVYLRLDNQFLNTKNKKYLIKAGQSITVNLIVKERPIITIFSDIFSKSIDSLKSIKSD